MKCMCCYNDRSTGCRFISCLAITHSQGLCCFSSLPSSPLTQVPPSVFLCPTAFPLVWRSQRQWDGMLVVFNSHSVTTMFGMDVWQAPPALLPALTGKWPSWSLQGWDRTSEAFWSKGDGLVTWMCSEVQTGMLAPIGILLCAYVITHETTTLFGLNLMDFLPVNWKVNLTEDRHYSISHK